MNFLKSIVNFYLYSSIHIAIAASVFSIELSFLFNTVVDLHLLLFVFFSTIFIYSIHRIIGLRNIPFHLINGRYAIITKYKSHIYLYAFISVIGQLYCLFFLPVKVLTALVILGIISIAYTLPIFSKRKRLRDFNFIKIFLIASCWAGISILQLIDTKIDLLILALLFIEHAIYIFAITLPFDIRDIDVDSQNEVKTLAAKWGVDRSYKVGIGLIAICSILYIIAILAMDLRIGLGGYFLLTLPFTMSIITMKIALKKTSDYYYTGLLDGTIIIRSAILILVFKFLF